MVGIDIGEAMATMKVKPLVDSEMSNKDERSDLDSGLFDSYVCHLSADTYLANPPGHLWGSRLPGCGREPLHWGTQLAVSMTGALYLDFWNFSSYHWKELRLWLGRKLGENGPKTGSKQVRSRAEEPELAAEDKARPGRATQKEL